MLQCTNIPE